MFRRYLPFAIMSVLILCLAACGSTGGNQPSESQNPSNLEESAPPESSVSGDEAAPSTPAISATPAPVPPPIQESVEPSETFYGSWQIDATITTLPVSSLSVEDLESRLGVILTYEETLCTAGDIILDSPDYQQSKLSDEQFAYDYSGLTLVDIGMSSGEVSAISIENSSDIGNVFFIKDDTTLIIYYEGAFFAAIRIS